MDKKKLQGFQQGLEQLLLLRKMPVQMASLFVYVALNDGAPMQKIAEHLGVSQSSCSRLVATLSDSYRDGNNDVREGIELLVAKEDPLDRRVKLVSLTAKGRKLADAISAVLH